MNKEKPATKICKYCKSEIPYDAKVCPNCRKKQQGSGCLIAVIVVVVMCVIAAIAGGKSAGTSAPKATEEAASSAASVSSPAEQTASSVETAPTAAPTEAKTSYVVGETAESNGIKVTLVNAETSTGANYMTPGEGNVYEILEFEIENGSSADITVSSALCFEAYCDDYAVNDSLMGTLLKTDKSGLDGGLAAGKKMNGVIAYEVPADFQQLEVTVTPSFWSGSKVTFTVTGTSAS